MSVSPHVNCQDVVRSAVGHIEISPYSSTVMFDDGAVLDGETAPFVNLQGTAHAGRGLIDPDTGLLDSSDHIDHYDILIMPQINPDSATPGVGKFGYKYRVSGRAVGATDSTGGDVDTPSPPRPPNDDGTPDNLIVHNPIDLPWGAYWMILAVRAVVDDPSYDFHFNWNGERPNPRAYNNDVAAYAYPTPERQLTPFIMQPGRRGPGAVVTENVLAGLTENGLQNRYVCIQDSQVVRFRVNRRECAH